MKQEQNLSESRAGFPSKAQERRREKRHIGTLEGRAGLRGRQKARQKDDTGVLQQGLG